MEGLFDLKAYRLMSLEESRKFKKEHPECVLPTRWVDRYKATDEGGAIAKSRIVIFGFMDPHILQLERSAPTPTNEARTCVCVSSHGQPWLVGNELRHIECIWSSQKDDKTATPSRRLAFWNARGWV